MTVDELLLKLETSTLLRN